MCIGLRLCSGIQIIRWKVPLPGKLLFLMFSVSLILLWLNFPELLHFCHFTNNCCNDCSLLSAPNGRFMLSSLYLYVVKVPFYKHPIFTLMLYKHMSWKIKVLDQLVHRAITRMRLSVGLYSGNTFLWHSWRLERKCGSHCDQVSGPNQWTNCCFTH